MARSAVQSRKRKARKAAKEAKEKSYAFPKATIASKKSKKVPLQLDWPKK